MKTFLYTPFGHWSAVTAILALSGLCAVVGAPVISEFLANTNASTLESSNGTRPDWLEIHNPDDAAYDLSGHHLTDDRENPRKWKFPAGTSIPADGYLLIFASGLEESPSGELHAGFQLSSAADGYLALTDTNGTLIDGYDGYPKQRSGVSYGVLEEALQFFPEPTPLSENTKGIDGFVADTVFSVTRGFYDEAFDLTIATATEGATINYTLDGSDPSKGSIFQPSPIYSGPIRIDGTTVVRAFAKKSGFESTNVDTHTYVFVDQVLTQTEKPENFPDRWGSVSADYEMDPRIVDSDPDAVKAGLRSLPTVSIALLRNDLFGSDGIYTNSDKHGTDWERPASVEWLDADGNEEFHITCGLRIQGGYFRSPSATQKHSFRFLFKDQYGAGKLRHDVFKEPGAATEFDGLVLRAGANDGYSWNAARDTEQFLRDEFGRRLMLDMGHPSPRGTFVHLYLNGLYWGLYNVCERPNEDFSQTYYGGALESWDSVNSGDVKSGSIQAWNRLVSEAGSVETPADYLKLQGLNPDRSRNPDYEPLLDSINYVDYMIGNLWGGNWDWPNKNFWFGYNRDGGERPGFKFYMWDFENTMGNNRGRSPLNMRAPRNTQWVGMPYDRLLETEGFQVEYSDRVQRFFFNGGLLTPDVLKERYSALADSVELAIYAETARWGDDHHSTPQDIDDWRRERDWMLNTYLDQRSAIVLDQFRDAGLFPKSVAPAYSQHGGVVSQGFQVEIDSPTDNVFYTTNGVDPYAVNPATGTSELHADVIAYTEPITIEETTTVKARRYVKSIFGSTTWSPLSEATFHVGAGDNLVIASIMYHPPDTSDSEIAAGFTNADDFEYIEIRNVGAQRADLAGISFTEGISFTFPADDNRWLDAAASVYVVSNLEAFRTRHGNGPNVAGAYEKRLNNGGELVVLTDAAGTIVHQIHYNDEAPWPIEADGTGMALLLTDPDSKPDASLVESWSAGPGLEIVGGGGGVTLAQWLTDNGLTDPEGDTDGDGLPEFFEFAVGTNPKATNSMASVFNATYEAWNGAGDANSLILRFLRSPDATGVTVTPEQSGDLQTWTRVTLGDWFNETSADAETQRVYRMPERDRVEMARYYRLRVTRE